MQCPSNRNLIIRVGGRESLRHGRVWEVVYCSTINVSKLTTLPTSYVFTIPTVESYLANVLSALVHMKTIFVLQLNRC